MPYDMVIDFGGTDRFRKRLSVLGYSDKAICYCLDKPNLGTLPDADIVSESTGSCDDTMVLYLKIDQGRITDARVDITGCAGTISSAMALVDLVKGKTMDEAEALAASDFMQLLGQFPDEKINCIHKALKTLKKAVALYRNETR